MQLFTQRILKLRLRQRCHCNPGYSVGTFLHGCVPIATHSPRSRCAACSRNSDCVVVAVQFVELTTTLYCTASPN